MYAFAGRCLLLDIEGTTSSLSFVHDRMFPEVRRRLESFLAEQWDDPRVREAIELIAGDAGHGSWAQWRGSTDDGSASARQLVQYEVLAEMDRDLKATGLKQLQGLIWRSSFESGELRAHLYDDVAPAMQAWHDAGRVLAIYSSGSVEAQRLFFGHTEQGDLLGLLSHHFDTTVGSKRDADSYRRIARQLELPGSEIVFLSDVVAELDAASEAGLGTVLCQRPGNAPVEPDVRHARITSFAQIMLVDH